MSNEFGNRDKPINWNKLQKSSSTTNNEPLRDAESLARAFHETYERLDSKFNYETRPESAVEWEAVPRENKALMIAVCGELLERIEADRKQFAEYVIGPDVDKNKPPFNQHDYGFMSANAINNRLKHQRRRAANYQKGEQE